MSAVLSCIGLPILLFCLRLGYVLMKLKTEPRQRYNTHKPARTLIILGSGGHTTEMIAVINELNKRNYMPRFYIVAHTDRHSETKALDVESLVESQSTARPNPAFEIHRIKRSREVQQSFATAISTTIQSIWQCIPLVYRLRPDLILCNGPGTCVPICLVAFIYKVLFINRHCRIVFIESYCRIRTISLTGKILVWFTDLFVVQWPQLANASKRIEYYGRLL